MECPGCHGFEVRFPAVIQTPPRSGEGDTEDTGADGCITASPQAGPHASSPRGRRVGRGDRFCPRGFRGASRRLNSRRQTRWLPMHGPHVTEARLSLCPPPTRTKPGRCWTRHGEVTESQHLLPLGGAGVCSPRAPTPRWTPHRAAAGAGRASTGESVSLVSGLQRPRCSPRPAAAPPRGAHPRTSVPQHHCCWARGPHSRRDSDTATACLGDGH